MAKSSGNKQTSSTQCEVHSPDILFTSKGWQYQSIKNLRNRVDVQLNHQATGALVHMTVESEAGPGYQLTYTYQQFLAPGDPQHNVIIEWLEAISSTFSKRELPALFDAPPALDQPIEISLRMDVASSAHKGQFRGTGHIRIAGILESEVEIGALHGSVEVTCRGSTVPVFLHQPKQASKVEMVNMHRNREDGAIEALVAIYNKQGLASQGIKVPRVEAGGEQTLPLFFPDGLLCKVLMPDGNTAINTFGNFLQNQIATSVLIGTGGVLMSVNGKYKCLRSILTMFGACLICTLGMLGASATGPGILAAAALCFGSKAIAIINLILGHMGFDP